MSLSTANKTKQGTFTTPHYQQQRPSQHCLAAKAAAARARALHQQLIHPQCPLI